MATLETETASDGVTADQVQLRTFRVGSADDARAFRELNEAWIEKHFGMEEQDYFLLGDPEGSILQHGGRIFFAESNGRRAGCCALIPEHPGVWELAKMAVAEECRGKGIGRALLVYAIDQARALDAKKIDLATNSKLPPAIRLYESVGFRHLRPDEVSAYPFARADVFMALDL